MYGQWLELSHPTGSGGTVGGGGGLEVVGGEGRGVGKTTVGSGVVEGGGETGTRGP